MKRVVMRIANKYILSDEIPFEARVLNLSAVCGLVGCIVATAGSLLLLSVTRYEIFFLIALDISILVSVFFVNRLKRYDGGGIVLTAIVGCVFIPALYFVCGGAESGMSVYMVMIAAFVFFMLRGIKCVVMLVLQLILFGVCLYIDLYFPEMISRPLKTREMIIADNAVAVLIVSIFIGMTIKFQAYMFAREKKKAENASRAKSEFLATMSHEIRTPLNTIIGLSEIVLERELPEETYSDIEKIYNSGTNLLGIINEILDISKIETGNFALVPFNYDIPSMINDVVQLNVVRIGSRPIEFRIFIDPLMPSVLYGDEMRMKQILNNLLSNAFKYTNQGHVSLRVTCKPENENAVLSFIVSDTGIGIRKADLAKLFSKYTQLDTKANRQIEGTGLGLSITKQLIQMMDGTISVESVYHQGSTFTVRIPQRIVNAHPIGKSIAGDIEALRSREGRNRDRGKKIVRTYMPYGRVLVVDDVATNLDVTRGLLLPYGLKADCVSSGPEAIEIIRRGASYDLILMDHMMPGMDGLEATRIIRQIGSDYASKVPIVALTANAVAGNEEMFLANGFNGFIPKPIDLLRLDAVLNRWVRDKENEETLRLTERECREKDDDSTAARILFGLMTEDIDVSEGIERYGNAGAYMKALVSYAKYTPNLIPAMTKISRDSLNEYKITVHGLKGASYGICANGIGNAAETLETAASEGRYEFILDKNGSLINDTERLIRDLSPLLKQINGIKGPLLYSPVEATLEKALDACVQFDASALENAMSELEKNDYETGGDLVEWLRIQADNLEYDAIAERLTEILTR